MNIVDNALSSKKQKLSSTIFIGLDMLKNSFHKTISKALYIYFFTSQGYPLEIRTNWYVKTYPKNY